MPKVQLSHWYRKVGGPGDVVEVSDVEAARIVAGKGGVLVTGDTPEKPAEPDPTPEPEAPAEAESEGDDETVTETPEPSSEKPKRSRKK